MVESLERLCRQHSPTELLCVRGPFFGDLGPASHIEIRSAFDIILLCHALGSVEGQNYISFLKVLVIEWYKNSAKLESGLAHPASYSAQTQFGIKSTCFNHC